MNCNEFKCSNLEELCIYVARGITPKYVENNGISVINQKCIRDFKINLELARQHNLSQKKISDVKYLKKYDVLINATGVGTAGRVAQWTEHKKVTCDSHVLIVRPNSSKIDPIYLGYSIKSKQKQIEMLAEGSTGQTEINKNRLNNEVEITYPKDIKDQKKIASILSALDDKIELNNKINKKLEEMAQAIFKSWFVDFEPWGGEMPDDWEYTSLSDIAEFTNGYSYKGKELQPSTTAMATIKNFERNGGFKIEGFKQIVSSGKLKTNHNVELFDLLVAHTDLTQKAEVLGNAEIILSKGNYEKIIFSMDLVKVIPKTKEISKFMLAALLKNKSFKSYCLGYVNGTTVLHLSKKALKEYKLFLPHNFSNLNPVNKIYENIYKIKSTNIKENEKFKMLRDTLLPKLMSGELDVSKLDIK